MGYQEQEAIDRAMDTLGDYFGEGFAESATLKAKGDGIVGRFVRIEEAVDLKTDFAPVDMLVLKAVAGVWHGDEGIERARRGTVYSVALMHQTLRNRLDEAAPIADTGFGEDGDEGELVAIRRGRVFESNLNPGNRAVAYDVAFPDRADEPAQPNGDEPKKSGSRGRSKPVANAPDPV